MELFRVVDTNPNEASGTGACLCSPRKISDCKPPYAVFFNAESDDPTNPHVVGCARCIKGAAKAMDGEALGSSVLNHAIRQSSVPKRKTPPAPVTTEPEVIEAEVVEDDYDI